MKLLICDDDISTIDVIQSQLDCQELGITSILRAYNGEAAREVIMKEKPELILCDIGMPKMDGVEVLKFIFENRIHTEFAFLTCFDDFEHARSAVRYGAKNYLTKPVDFQELNEALHRMANAARSYQAQVREKDDGRQSDAAFNNLLRQLLQGFYGTSPDRVEEILLRNGIRDFRADTPVRLVMTYEDLTEAGGNSAVRERIVSSFSTDAEGILAHYTGLRSTVVDVSDRYLSSVTLLRSGGTAEEEFTERARELIRCCSEKYRIHPVCLIGEEGPFSSVSQACAALKLLIRRVLLRAGNVFLQREAERITESSQAVVHEEELLRLLRRRDRSAFLKLIEEALGRIAVSQKDTGSMMTLLHKEISSALSSCLADNQIPAWNLFRKERFHDLNLYAERSAADMREFSVYCYDAVMSELEGSSDAAGLVDAVRHYIRHHYKENLTRNSLAEVVHITPNYLSKRFHAETGMSLREYINQLRIEDARRRLLSTNATISEIASEVGFDNISYFSTVFRKICGVSPIEWSRGDKTEGGNGTCE